jgi:hypothetical protein
MKNRPIQRTLTLFHCPLPVANVAISGGADGLGDEGEGAGGGYLLPPGVRGLGPRENFLQIDVENMHFRGHVYAVFVYFITSYLKQKCQLIFLSQVSAFMKLTTFLE